MPLLTNISPHAQVTNHLPLFGFVLFLAIFLPLAIIFAYFFWLSSFLECTLSRGRHFVQCSIFIIENSIWHIKCSTDNYLLWSFPSTPRTNCGYFWQLSSTGYSGTHWALAPIPLLSKSNLRGVGFDTERCLLPLRGNLEYRLVKFSFFFTLFSMFKKCLTNRITKHKGKP